jgi:hypothetical protein
MGAWGPGLYQSDTASDLKSKFVRLARLPVSGLELSRRMMDGEASASNPGDEDHTTFWLVLADQFHRYGIEGGDTLARAVGFIDRGDDDRVMAELEMSSRDRAKRRRELEALKAKWLTPNPKPANRRLLKAPEPFIVAEGDIWAFPVEDGNPPNTYMPAEYIDRTFKPNGWSAFAIVANRHLLGWFAASFFVRLQADGPERPDLNSCLGSFISGTRMGYVPESQPPAQVAGWVEISRTALKKMRAEKIGSAPFDGEVVARALNGFVADETREPWSLAGCLHCWQRLPGSSEWLQSAQPLDIHMRDLLRKRP